MIFQISDIVRDIRIAIDENDTSAPLIGENDIDTLSLDDIVRSKICEAVRRVESGAPVYLLEEGHSFDTAIFWEDKGSGMILLPDDFMRLIVFKMSDWERSVYEAISVADPTYQLQHSRYKGIRGNTQKPVCAIVNRAVGKALEFYSCNSEAAYVQQASYLPYPTIDEDGGIDICERCYEAVVYMAASLVLTTYGETEKAKAMTELSNTILQ